MSAVDRPRCEFDGRFLSDAHVNSWAFFAAEEAAFCPDHARRLPGGHEERQATLRGWLTDGSR